MEPRTSYISTIPYIAILFFLLLGIIGMGIAVNAGYRFNDLCAGRCQCPDGTHLENTIAAIKTMEIVGSIGLFSLIIAFILAFIFCPFFRLVFCMSAATMGTLWVAKQTYKKLKDD